jgi:dihydroorotase
MEKEVEFDRAANGIIGLETALALALRLVDEGVLDIGRLVERMSIAPARILGLESGLRVGMTADITLIDPIKEWVVNVDKLKSKSRNTPFEDWAMKGKAVMTLIGGSVILDDLA